jgi:hypothetical protein
MVDLEKVNMGVFLLLILIYQGSMMENGMDFILSLGGLGLME